MNAQLQCLSPLKSWMGIVSLTAIGLLMGCNKEPQSTNNGEAKQPLSQILDQIDGAPANPHNVAHSEALPKGHPPLGEGKDGVHNSAHQPSIHITGVVKVSKGISMPKGHLFIMARLVSPDGPGAVAFAKRISSPVFPQSFVLTNADMMMQGMPVDVQLHIEARLDQDGDAISRTIGDVRGQAAKAVPPTASSVEVLLTQVIKEAKPTRAVGVAASKNP